MGAMSRTSHGIPALVALLAASACSPPAPARGPGSAPLGVEPLRTPPRTPGPRWAVPSCPLAYEVAVLESIDLAGPASKTAGSRLETFVELAATARDGKMELTAGVASQPLVGRHRSYVPPEKRHARPIVETDGVRWTERDGHTQLWSAMGTQGGLAWYFPALPASGEPGASVTWEAGRADAAEVYETEKRRGGWGELFARAEQAQAAALASSGHAHESTFAVKDPRVPGFVVRLERWSEEGGQRIAHLSMTGDHVQDAGGALLSSPITMHVSTRWKGSYEVLSSGRLLSATIEKDADVAMSSDGHDQQQKQHATMRASLVKACDGPTRPPLAVPPTREERAIRAWTETWRLISAEPDQPAALAHFDPVLRKQHGDASLWRTFGEYKTLRGDRALMPALLVSDEDVRVEGEVVRLRVHGQTKVPTEANTVTGVDVDVTLRETGGQFLVTELRAVKDPGFTLLEVSPARLAVPKGWPRTR